MVGTEIAAGIVKRAVFKRRVQFVCVSLSNSVLVHNFTGTKIDLTKMRLLLLLAALSSLAYGEFARKLFCHIYFVVECSSVVFTKQID